MYYKKLTIFLLTLMILLMGVGMVSASDNLTDTQQSSQLSDTDNSYLPDNNLESISKDNINFKDQKVIKKSFNPYTGDMGDDFIGNIHEINEENYNEFFSESGYLKNNVEEGDILDIQGTISNKNGININKAVNIISTTNDGEFNNVSIFSFKHDGSYSNMTGLKVSDSKFFVENATGIIINNVNISVINFTQSLGTGIFSIRDASNHITFTNSQVYCENNGGTSLGVIAAAQYCTFENNTFHGSGNVGNLLYLTSFNVNDETITNDYNKFINNKVIKTDSESNISWGIAVYGKYNQFINNTVQTKGPGIAVQWGKKSEDCPNNYFEGNIIESSSITTFYNSTYVNNTFSTTSAITFSNNTNVTGNMFNKNVTIGSNVSFVNNIVNTPDTNYAVTINGNNSIVKDNGLTSKTATGNDAVYDKTGNNEISNNDDRQVLKKPTEYILEESTYDDFFDNEGSLYDFVEDGDIFLVRGELIDRTLGIYNKTVVFKTHPDTQGVLINTQIIVADTGKVTIDSLEMYTDNEDMDNMIYIGTSGNKIINTTISQTTNAPKAHSLIIDNDNNTIINSRFELTGPSYRVDFDNMPNYASMINLRVSSSYNVIKNNTFIIKAKSGESWGTVEALTFQNDNVDIVNNIIEDNRIYGEGIDYIYGINFGGYVYENIVKNNTINITSQKYANAIQFMVSPAGNNQIIANNINITAGENDGDSAYGVIFSSWGEGLFENNQINDNDIIVSANQAYGIEIFNSVSSNSQVVLNTSIKNNTITTYGVYASGIAVMGTTHNITGNHLEIHGQTNQTGQSADYIKPTTAGIIIQKVTNSIVYDNYMGVENGPTHRILQNSKNITIEENILYSTQGESSDSIVIVSGEDINIGLNYPYNKASIVVDGDYIIGGASELSVRIVDENGNILKKVNGIVTIIIDDEMEVELTNGQGEFTVESNESQLSGVAYYSGSDIIAAAEDSFTLIGEVQITMTLEDSRAVIGEYLPLVAHVSAGNDEINEGTVIFYVDDEEITRADVIDNMAETSCYLNNNWYKKNITITAVFTDSKTYPETQAQMKPTIIIPTNMEISSINDIKIGKSITTVIRLNDSVSNTQILPGIKSYVNGQQAGKLGLNPQIRAFTFSYTPEEVGVYEIRFVYEGGVINGYTYNASEYATNVTVEGYNTTINIDNIESKKGEQTIIPVTVTSTDGLTVTDGTVKIIDESENILAQNEITDGQTTLQITFNKTGTQTLKVTYESTSNKFKTSESEITAVITSDKLDATIRIDPVSIIKNEQTIITAYVMDENGEIINTGKVVFKINGKTIKDANGKVIYANVENGVANISTIIDNKLLTDNVTITAIYSGTSNIQSASAETNNVTINEPEVRVELDSITAKAGSNTTITVKVYSGDNEINEGKVILKINGKTVKDNAGKVVYAQVINGIATINYTVPENMKQKNYTMSAVFTSTNYPRANADAYLTIEDN